VNLCNAASIRCRLEGLDIKKPHGLAKAMGTLVSLAGVLTITLYRGPTIKHSWESPIHLTRGDFQKDWIKGPILSVASCITWSIWFTMQVSHPYLEKFTKNLKVPLAICIKKTQ